MSPGHQHFAILELNLPTPMAFSHLQIPAYERMHWPQQPWHTLPKQSSTTGSDLSWLSWSTCDGCLSESFVLLQAHEVKERLQTARPQPAAASHSAAEPPIPQRQSAPASSETTSLQAQHQSVHSPDVGSQAAATAQGSRTAAPHQPAPPAAGSGGQPEAGSAASAEAETPSWVQLRARLAHLFSPEAEPSGKAGSAADAEQDRPAPVQEAAADSSAALGTGGQARSEPEAQLAQPGRTSHSPSLGLDSSSQPLEMQQASDAAPEPGTCLTHVAIRQQPENSSACTLNLSPQVLEMQLQHSLPLACLCGVRRQPHMHAGLALHGFPQMQVTLRL